MGKLRLLTSVIVMLVATSSWAWPGMKMSALHVDGRYLTDEDGNVVNLHGFAQTYSPWFNERGTKWTDYNAERLPGVPTSKKSTSSLMPGGR